MRTGFYIALFVLITSLFLGCTADKVTPINPDCPDEISFSQSIEPMILNNCSTSGCHNVAGPGKPALTNHSEISANASLINTVINKNPGDVDFMPLGGQKLADSLLQQFKCWIDQGLQNN